jgi:uncharacterized protein YqjF (DUF2071 family)
MYQAWHDLLFLHWAWDPAAIQATLPPGLHVDTFEDRAWVGVVPFWMDAVRPRGLPPLPGLSWFQELNLRTYVHDDDGEPGVWFYCLDCNQPIATQIARTFFNLNYQHARQAGRRAHPDHPAEFYSYRRTTQGESHFRYQATGVPFFAEPESLDFFLTERYRLFAAKGNQLSSGRVWHEPYPLQTVRVEQAETALWVDQGFNAPERRADHALTSSGVSVSVYPLSRLL